MKDVRVQIFLGQGGWRWRMVAGNDQIIAIGGKGRASSGGARRAFKAVERAFDHSITFPFRIEVLR